MVVASGVEGVVAAASVEEAAGLGPAADFPAACVRQLEVLRRSADRPRGHRHQLLDQPLVHPPRIVRRCRALGRVQELVRGQVWVAATSDRGIIPPCNRGIDRTSARVAVRLPIVLRHCRAIDRARALDRDRELAPVRALRIAPERARASRIVLERGPGLRTVLVSHSFRRIDYRDSALPQGRVLWAVPPRRVCRIKERACRIAWPIARSHWKTADPT